MCWCDRGLVGTRVQIDTLNLHQTGIRKTCGEGLVRGSTILIIECGQHLRLLSSCPQTIHTLFECAMNVATLPIVNKEFMAPVRVYAMH